MPTRKGQSDISGNSVASAAAFDRELSRIGAIMLKWEQTLESLEADDMLITGANFQAATGGRADYLLVVRGSTGEQKYVCFASGDTLHAAINNFVGMYRSGTLRWKNDQYSK